MKGRAYEAGALPLEDLLLHRSLEDVAVKSATEATSDYPILPWVNVIKIGGQSLIDRGRAAVYPIIDEIVANLGRHRVVPELLLRARLATQFQIINGLVPGNLTRALRGEHVGSIVYK